MGVVNIGLKQVCYYDSMSASAGQIAFFGETMLRWVKDEHQNKKGAPLPDEKNVEGCSSSARSSAEK